MANKVFHSLTLFVALTFLTFLTIPVYSIARGFITDAPKGTIPIFAPEAKSKPIPSSAPSPEPVPYWKSNTKIYQRMKDERATIVSAKSEDVGDQKQLTVITAGIIHAPVTSSHDGVMDFDHYKNFVPYIEESSFDKTTQNAFIHGAFIGSHIRMTLHVHSQSSGEGFRTDWESVAGGLIGMKGEIFEKKIDNEHTEISMNAKYLGKTIGVPAFILNWGIEIAGAKAANAMRTHIEEGWQKTKKH